MRSYGTFNSRLNLYKKNSLKQKNNETENLNFSINYSMNLSDCFSNKCKKMKKHFSKLKFPTSKDSIDFKFNFYKTLKDLNFTNNINISSSEFFYLRKFKLEKPFKIIDCDKNVGTCLINKDL